MWRARLGCRDVVAAARGTLACWFAVPGPIWNFAVGSSANKLTSAARRPQSERIWSVGGQALVIGRKAVSFRQHGRCYRGCAGAMAGE